MYLALRLFFRHERQYQYPRLYRLVFQLISVVVTLLAYWLTSNALSQFMDFSKVWQARSYFEFLVIGELAILIPLSLSGAGTRALRFIASEQLLEDLSLSKGGLPLPLAGLMTSYVLQDLVQTLFYLFVACTIFGLSVSALHFVGAFALVALALPAFLGLGLLSAAILLFFGRGEGAVGQTLHLATVFSGVYFPLATLPAWAQEILLFVSPLTGVVQAFREILQGSGSPAAQTLLIILLWNLLALVAGWQALNWAVRRSRQKGFPLLSHY